MSLDQRISDALSKHPCFNEKAHTQFARIHVPVAPRCNIQCNYCNRRFDCCNESRPGVTSEVLSPEQAVDRIRTVRERIPNLSVVGIAGPGDPLANEETLETLEIIGREFPDLTMCISTNGLSLPGNAQRLYDLGVRFVTVTMNAPDAETGSKIYSFVNSDGRRLDGIEGASLLLERQKDGIRLCSSLGMVVKVNIVMIPGINDMKIPELVKQVKELGAYIVNILPLIPVKGTAFEHLRAPTPLERRALMDRCEIDATMMRHCRQCRADAVGLLGEDRSQEFAGCRIGGCGAGSGCGPSAPMTPERDPLSVAVATGPDGEVCGFGNASSFGIYRKENGRIVHVRDVPVDCSSPVSGRSHRAHIASIVDSIRGCGAVIVSEIGEMPKRVLSDADIEARVLPGIASDAAVSFLEEQRSRPSDNPI